MYSSSFHVLLYSTKILFISDHLCQLRQFCSIQVPLISDRLCQLRKSWIKANLPYIHQDYRKRFGIESSYRLKNICRIRTTNKKPVLRLLFVGVS
nr:hypothetical protein [Nostoc sp. EkiNYC01]